MDVTTSTTAAHRFRLERAAASPDEEPRWFLEKTGVDPATSDWLKGPGRLSEVRSELERELGSKVAAERGTRVLKEYEGPVDPRRGAAEHQPRRRGEGDAPRRRTDDGETGAVGAGARAGGDRGRPRRGLDVDWT